MLFDTTICAPASAPGGAISLIRVSGEKALEYVDTIFAPAAADASPLASAKGWTLHYGNIMDGGSVIDDVVVSVFRAPHSYTGENMAEISCHGSNYIVGRIMDLLVSCGAQSALPGEFTKRAFVNGKMDLAQAEAVADLIAAETAGAHRVGLSQLKGGFSGELSQMREAMLHIASLMELELDFSEEEVEFADRSELAALVDSSLEHINRLIDSFSLGNALKNGVPVAIVGATNSGKSTLLNALLGEERAIVSDIAGTTRDTIEECLNLGGIQFRFIDTAGIRETSDKIESIGIERSFKALANATVVIGVIDGLIVRKDFLKAAREIISRISPNQKLLLVRNKVDMYDVINPEEFPTHDRSYGFLEIKYTAFGTYDCTPEELAAELGIDRLYDISAATGYGLDALREAILASVCGNLAAASASGSGAPASGSAASGASVTLVTNARHLEALRNAASALSRLRSGLGSCGAPAPASFASDSVHGASTPVGAQQVPTDLLAQDLREALYHLGTITGEITTDEVLGNIFSKFCIGK